MCGSARDRGCSGGTARSMGAQRRGRAGRGAAGEGAAAWTRRLRLDLAGRRVTTQPRHDHAGGGRPAGGRGYSEAPAPDSEDAAGRAVRRSEEPDESPGPRSDASRDAPSADSPGSSPGLGPPSPGPSSSGPSSPGPSASPSPSPSGTNAARTKRRALQFPVCSPFHLLRLAAVSGEVYTTHATCIVRSCSIRAVGARGSRACG